MCWNKGKKKGRHGSVIDTGCLKYFQPSSFLKKKMGFNELELFMGISEKYLLSFLLFFLLLLTKLKK